MNSSVPPVEEGFSRKVRRTMTIEEEKKTEDSDSVDVEDNVQVMNSVDSKSPSDDECRDEVFQNSLENEGEETTSLDRPAGEEEEEEVGNGAMELNVAFTALETMRMANLELELGQRVDGRHCVECLRQEKAKRNSGGERRRTTSWGVSRRTGVPCLVCNSPTCPRHASKEFQAKKVTVCSHCAPLFGLDFIVDLIHNGEGDSHYRKRAIEQVINSYDRALVVLKYFSQYVIEDTIAALGQSAARDNRIGLGSSSVGLMSGVTGMAAAAIHLVAYSTLAAATVLTPVGPPLLIASIVFGGTAAAASSGSEAVSYFSEPNQIADRIMALHELITSLLKVTVTLRDALTHGRIDLDVYFKDDKAYADATSRSKKKAKESASPTRVSKKTLDDGPKRSPWRRNTPSTTPKESVAPETVTVLSDIDTDDVVNSEQAAASIEGKSAEETDATIRTSTSEEEQTISSTEGVENDESMSLSETSEKKWTTAKKSDNVGQVATRTATTTMKAVQVASVACGVLSVASVILEARNMANTLERMKAGNRHPKAEILLAIRDEIDKLPDTAMIAKELHCYLRHEAEQETYVEGTIV